MSKMKGNLKVIQDIRSKTTVSDEDLARISQCTQKDMSIAEALVKSLNRALGNLQLFQQGVREIIDVGSSLKGRNPPSEVFVNILVKGENVFISVSEDLDRASKLMKQRG